MEETNNIHTNQQAKTQKSISNCDKTKILASDHARVALSELSFCKFQLQPLNTIPETTF